MNAEKTAVTYIQEGDNFLESGNLDEASQPTAVLLS
jgi:hypothetical protein